MHAFRKQIRGDMPPLRRGSGNDGGVITDTLNQAGCAGGKSALERSNELEFLNGVFGFPSSHGCP
jgi:hypothetical protein